MKECFWSWCYKRFWIIALSISEFACNWYAFHDPIKIHRNPIKSIQKWMNSNLQKSIFDFFWFSCLLKNTKTIYISCFCLGSLGWVTFLCYFLGNVGENSASLSPGSSCWFYSNCLFERCGWKCWRYFPGRFPLNLLVLFLSHSLSILILSILNKLKVKY